MKAETLAIDIETYSEVDLIKSGVYAYTDDDSFEILLFAYSVDDGPVKVIDLAQGETIPKTVLEALTDPEILKTAYNANFERTCLSKHTGDYMEPEQWRCTAVDATTLGLPGNLDGVAKCLKLDVQKDSSGKALIRYFSLPCKPTKVNEGRTRNMPEHDPEKWEQYKTYCRIDVEVEMAIRQKLQPFLTDGFEQKLWALDQRINDKGVQLDMQLVDHAIACHQEYADLLVERAKKLTGLANPNSVAQLKKWLSDQGYEFESLSKAAVGELLETIENEQVKEVLLIRQELGKTSVKKYEAMKRAVCKDNRVRGLLQFYGASRTGRWAGRLVQVQNLPQNKINDLDNARNLLREGLYEMVETLFGQTPFVLSQLIRTAFVPSNGHRLIVSDFSSIEARVIAWFAGEKWRLNVFQTHGKIYEASAAQMFNVPIETIDKGNPLRQKGKVSELALGYGGGPGALKAMGALNMGLEEHELPGLVRAWRKANPNIVKFWWDCERAAMEAVQDKTSVRLQYGLIFQFKNGILFIQLPSGRKLAYLKPRLEEDERFGKLALTYEGVGDNRQWTKINTYGGKLVENIVQATARDCLAESMIRLDEAGYPIIMHVHDEIIADVPNDEKSLSEMEELMGQTLDWAPGLPLDSDGFETAYYKKD